MMVPTFLLVSDVIFTSDLSCFRKLSDYVFRRGVIDLKGLACFVYRDAFYLSQVN